jgi:hypothetical protein
MVRVMRDDDPAVTSGLYRLSPPRKRARAEDLSEAPTAAQVTGQQVGEALDAAQGTDPGPAQAGGISGPGRTVRQWPRRLGHALARVDAWILIATVAGVITAYLALVKPR